MSTLEKLFVQIFERKNWIIDLVKQQTDLYDQYLASKLLIDGIRPPPWLLKGRFETGSSDLEELKKEEIISGLLIPPSRQKFPSSIGHGPLYNKTFVTLDNQQLSDGLLTETCASNKYLGGDKLAAVPKCRLNECKVGAIDGVPELDPTTTSPQDQKGARVSDTYYEPCHSLARIQRSRSRQKALELRNSVKGKRKQHPSKKFNAYPGRITRSRTACQQSNSTKELLELNKSSDIVNGSGGGVTHAKTEKCPTKENGTSAHSGRIARSRTSCRQSVRGTLELDKSSDITNGGVDRVTSLKSVSMQSNATGKSLQTSEPLSWVEGDNYFQNAQGAQADIPNSSSMPKDLEFYNCVETNAEQLSINGDISNKVIVRKARPQALQLNFVEGLLEPNNSSKIPSGRVTCSRSVSTGKSSQFAKSLKWIEGLDGDRAPGTHLVVPLCNDVNTINQEKYDAGIVETGLVSDVPDEACSICSGSNMHGASLRDGLEFLVSRLPSDISTFVEPKQLVFVDMEESVDPALEKEGQVGSSEMRPVTSLGPSESLEKANISNDLCEKHDSSVDEQLLEKEHVKEVANREKQARRISSEVQAEEKFEFDEIEKSKHHLNPTLIGKNSYLSAATSRKGTSEICEDAIADNSPDNNKTSKQGPSVTNDLITLQVGEKSSIGSQLPKAVDFIVPDVDVDPQMDRSCEKCNEEQDLEPRKIFPEDCKLETVTCNGHKGAVDTDFNSTTGFSLIRKPAMLLGAQETEISNVFASDATRRSVLGHTATPDAAQVNNAEREAPYYLRSSTSCDKNVGCSNSSGSRIVKKSIRSTKYANNALEGSWPQYKRRKLEDRSNNAFTDSPRLRRVKPVQKIYEDNECRDLKSVESDAEAVLDHHITCEGDVAQSNDTESLDVEMHQSGKLHKTERFEFSAKLQVNEGELKLEGRDQGANTILTLTHKQVESSLDSSLKKEANGDSQSCLKDRVGMENPTSFALDIKGQSPWENYQNLLHHEGNLNLGSTELVGHTEGTMLESHLGEYGFLSYCAVSSPHTKGLDMIGADQNMPEFERFSIGSPRENNVPCFARNGISFDKSDLSSTITGQVSVLEQRYRSGSMLTPLSQVPTKFNLHTTPDIYQSLPNGLLKYMDLRSTMLSNDDNGNQRKHSYSGLSEEVDHTLGRSHSNCIPSSSVRFGWDVKRQPCTPPVGKFCQRITSNSLGGSSEKQENINPELTCFRIDEGPSICEENGAIDEGDDPVQEGVHSVGNNSLTNIEPLGDVTIKYLNPSALVPSAEKSLNRGSLDSVNAGFNFSETQMDVKQKLANCYGSDRRYKIEDKESQSSSLGGNGARKANDSLHNRFSKPISRKASEENGGRIFIEKGYKPNNIVSNISSFVPLVQQKQPAGILTGKRDIKVKALEAAEAARRFEEKRENERKKKKEAAKLERARMEQENMRQLELKQIKKEEERKKKEADMAARKRLREEEERKEKERKRKCIEEARRQQREHEEKLRVKKEEKEIRRRAADNREQKGKELAVEARKHQKMEKGREGASCGTKTDTEPRTAMVSTCTAREANNIHQDCQAPKESNDIENDKCNLNKVHEDNILITEGSREQSYEISPYQLSDDEDEEEDDIPNRKFIPSWASENCLAQILPSLKKIDPDEIFPLSSFCSIAEVLLPRLK